MSTTVEENTAAKAQTKEANIVVINRVLSSQSWPRVARMFEQRLKKFAALYMYEYEKWKEEEGGTTRLGELLLSMHEATKSLFRTLGLLCSDGVNRTSVAPLWIENLYHSMKMAGTDPWRDGKFCELFHNLMDVKQIDIRFSPFTQLLPKKGSDLFPVFREIAYIMSLIVDAIDNENPTKVSWAASLFDGIRFATCQADTATQCVNLSWLCALNMSRLKSGEVPNASASLFANGTVEVEVTPPPMLLEVATSTVVAKEGRGRIMTERKVRSKSTVDVAKMLEWIKLSKPNIYAQLVESTTRNNGTVIGIRHAMAAALSQIYQYPSTRKGEIPAEFIVEHRYEDIGEEAVTGITWDDNGSNNVALPGGVGVTYDSEELKEMVRNVMCS